MWYNMNFVELRTPINMRIIIRQVGEFCSKAFFFFFMNLLLVVNVFYTEQKQS